MAERRMINLTICDSDEFLNMPQTTQCLYFHLLIRADDDGFVNNPLKIMRMIGANRDEMQLLIAKRYVLAFDSGVIVIRHWRLHNYIRKDRYRPSLQPERDLLDVDKQGAYVLKDDCQPLDNQVTTTCQPTDNQLTTTCQPSDGQSGYQRLTQYRLVKNSIDKYSKDKDKEEEKEEKVVVVKNENDEIQKTRHLFESNIHPFSGLIEANQLDDLIKDFGPQRVSEAIKEAVSSNVRTIRYITGILRNWQENGGMKNGPNSGAAKGGANHTGNNGKAGQEGQDYEEYAARILKEIKSGSGGTEPEGTGTDSQGSEGEPSAV